MDVAHQFRRHKNIVCCRDNQRPAAFASLGSGKLNAFHYARLRLANHQPTRRLQRNHAGQIGDGCRIVDRDKNLGIGKRRNGCLQHPLHKRLAANRHAALMAYPGFRSHWVKGAVTLSGEDEDIWLDHHARPIGPCPRCGKLGLAFL